MSGVSQNNEKKERSSSSNPASDHPLAMVSRSVIQEHSVFSWLMSSEKLPWTLSSLASLLYLVLFVSRVSCDRETSANKLCWKPLMELTDGLHGGFCVWGSDLDTGLCASELENSHQFSFYVDSFLTAATFVVGHCVKPYHDNTFLLALLTGSIGIMIFLHGFLHFVISKGIQCSDDHDDNHGILKHCWQVCPNAPHPDATPAEWAMYILYNLGLILLDFSMANFHLPLTLQMILIIVITTAWVLLGAFIGSEWSLSSVFVQSHVMVSLTGIFANSHRITSLMGWCFLVATCVGLTEFLACKPFLLARYGHVWYDATLHVAMVATLIPRPNKPSRKVGT